MALLVTSETNATLTKSDGTVLTLTARDKINYDSTTGIIEKFIIIGGNPKIICRPILSENQLGDSKPVMQLDSVQKVVGGRKSRKNRKSRNKSRRYRRV